MKLKIIITILFFLFFSIHLNAEERFSFQSKPTLYFIPVVQSVLPPVIFGVEPQWKPFIIIIDIEFQYALTEKFALFINPVFAQGFWKYAAIEGDAYFNDYYSSNCLDFVTGFLYRPFGTGLRGMYLGIFSIIGWGYVNHGYFDNGSERAADFLNLGFIAEIGYGWIFKNGFSLTIGAGITGVYQVPKISIVTAVNAYYNDMYNYGNLHGIYYIENFPIAPRLKLSIGYSF